MLRHIYHDVGYPMRYQGPSPDTLRSAYGSAMTGQISSIPQNQPNMSYTLEFLGPALHCENADAAVISAVNGSYARWSENSR